MTNGYRMLQGGKSKKNQMQRRAEELKRIEGRERKFMEGIAGDFVRMRQMLEQMATALESHDTTIAALRSLLVQHCAGVTEELVDSRRDTINKAKLRKAKENEQLAHSWNAQIEKMKSEGVTPAEIQAIIHEARETLTEPELIRMKRVTLNKVITDAAIPEEAFVYGG